MLKSILVLLLIAAMIGGGGGAVYATTAFDVYQHDHTVNSNKVCGGVLCGDSTPTDRIPVFEHVGELNNPKSLTTNYSFVVIETPTGVSYNNIVLSGENATALKNNVGIFTACGSFAQGLCQPPVPTTQAPTNNYCPIAKSILLNQGSYLNYTFVQEANGTIKKDLTHFVYPDYCLPETGQNPYSPIPVVAPEFGGIACIVMVVAIVFGMAITASKNKQFSPQ